MVAETLDTLPLIVVADGGSVVASVNLNYESLSPKRVLYFGPLLMIFKT